MQKLLVLTLMAFIANFSMAQTANISESKETMKLGTFNSLTVQLPNSSDKVALNVWKDYVKGHGAKAKKVKKSKEYLASGAIIADINNSEEIDIYTRVREKSSNAELTVWFSMGEFYVSSAAFPTDYTAATKFLQDYADEVAKQLVMDELEAEEKVAKKMDSEMNKLKKKNDGYHKDIEKAKKAIAKAEENIEENEREQLEQESLMEDQKKKLEAIREKLSKM